MQRFNAIQHMVCYSVHASEMVAARSNPTGVKIMAGPRSAVQIMREMALVRSQTKHDPAMQKILLKPLEDELNELVEFAKQQQTLDFEPDR